MTKLITAFVLLCLLTGEAGAQQIRNFYRPGDWIGYTNSRYVTAIARGFNTIYFGTTGGILRYDMLSEQWLDPLTISDGMPENRIRRLAVDPLTDDIWIETTNFNSYYNPVSEEWEGGVPFNNQVQQSAGISIRQLPQLITPFGYNYFPQGVLISSDLREYPINQLLRDRDDDVWIGFWGLGAAKTDLATANLELLPFGLYDRGVVTLAVDGSDLWFLGGDNGSPGAITLYERYRGNWHYFQPQFESEIISDHFNSLEFDDENVWIGTDVGLVRFDRKYRRFRSLSVRHGIYGERVLSLLSARDNLIIGTDLGVSVYDLKRDSIYNATSNNIRGRVINDLDRRGKVIYAATNYGLFSLRWGGGEWQRLTFNSPVLKGVVEDIQIVDSVLYAVSDDGVVVVDLDRNSYELFDRHLTFEGARLTEILVHRGVLWVGGEDGLFRLNKRTGNWYHYTPADGLLSYTITSLAGDGDYIWIGTDQGANRFLWGVPQRSDWLQ